MVIRGREQVDLNILGITLARGGSKGVKKKNIRPDNIGEIILSQIPGISSKTSAAIMQHFDSLYELLTKIQKDGNCLNEITIKSKNGKRKLSKSVISSIKTYLLYNKDSVVIKINT